jgi:CRISPR-associated protein Csb2
MNMLIIELEFPAGRYHANPWGRNVNEGEVEWPPSTYRLGRALIDIWKRRRPDWSDERMHAVLKSLSGTAWYSLPPATPAHTRSFLSSNQTDPSSKQLIFDAFVVISRAEKVYIGLGTNPEPSAVEHLDELLSEVNYLGRSESWVKASVRSSSSGIDWNCLPWSPGNGHNSTDIVRVACMLPPDDYAQLPYRPERIESDGKRLVKTGKACSWCEALSLSTKRLLDEGWSDPPALLWRDYARSPDALTIRPPRSESSPREVRYTKYALVSRVLPRVTETASFAEKIRRHLMGIHARIQNDPNLVSQTFSGKTPEGKPLDGHSHAFYVPLDEDDDGRLDHLLVYAKEPFDASELKALNVLRSVWQSDGRPDVQIVLTSLAPQVPRRKSVRWISSTPFVTTRHYRKGRGTYLEWLKSEILHECRFHDLPVPVEIEWVPSTLRSEHPVHWMDFIRSRKGEFPLRGSGCILTFEAEVEGPFVLGARCHYGLGLFMPFPG